MIILSFVLRFLVSIAFIIMASVRFCQIRPIGFAKTTIYSKLFLAKVYFQYLLAVLISILVLVFLIDGSYKDSEYHEVIKEQKFFSIFLIFEAIAWFIAAKMMRYEYRKRLSESYPHWIFWACIAVLDSTFIFLSFDIYVYFRICLPYLGYFYQCTRLPDFGRQLDSTDHDRDD